MEGWEDCLNCGQPMAFLLNGGNAFGNSLEMFAGHFGGVGDVRFNHGSQYNRRRVFCQEVRLSPPLAYVGIFALAQSRL